MLSRRRFLLASAAACIVGPAVADAIEDEDGVMLLCTEHPATVFWAGRDGLYASTRSSGSDAWSNLSENCADLSKEGLERLMVQVTNPRVWGSADLLPLSFPSTTV